MNGQRCEESDGLKIDSECHYLLYNFQISSHFSMPSERNVVVKTELSASYDAKLPQNKPVAIFYNIKIDQIYEQTISPNLSNNIRISENSDK